MRKTTIAFVLALLALIVSISCIPSTTLKTPVDIETKIMAPAIEKEQEPWLKHWNEKVGAARKEGKIVVYTTAHSKEMMSLARAFQKNFGIPMEFITGRGAEMSRKLKMEHLAGLYLADVYVGGATTVVTQIKPAGLLEPLEPVLVLPQVKDPKAWWNGHLLWIDQERKYLAFSARASPIITINDTMVKPEEIKSYKDLLQPRWKGKIILNDPTIAGSGSKFFRVVGEYIMGWDFMRALARQEPIIMRDLRLMNDWLARGRYPVGIALQGIEEFMKAGAPVSYIAPVEGTWLANGNGGLGLVTRAPHPMAAIVFVNWMLDKEAQTIYSTAAGYPSARQDVTTEGIDPIAIPRPGAKYIIGFKEELLLAEMETRDLAQEIFGPLIRR